MIPFKSAHDRAVSRNEKAAYRWVTKMIEDPECHRPGLERWLAQDPARLDIYRRVSGNLETATWAAKRAPFPPRRRRSALSRLALPGLAIGGLAVAGIALVALRPGWLPGGLISGTETPVRLAGVMSFDNPGPDIQTAPLPDGSIITLTPSSRVDLRYSKSLRGIVLRSGRVRFDVAHDADRPFIVYAGGGHITAVGTLFDVALGSVVQVHLLRGTVDVASPRQAGEQAPVVRLTAGHQTSYKAAASITPPNGIALATPPSAEIARPLVAQAAPTSPRLQTFDDMTLDAIVAQVNLTSDVQIQIDDPSLGRQRAFVELAPGDGRDAAFKLATLFHLEARQLAPRVIGLHRPS